jgi:hypothetical protein
VAYIAWVRYGTANSGCDDYLGLSRDGESYVLVNDITQPAIRFNTLDEAKEAVHQWCEKTRAGLIRAGLHSGQAWNQTREGAWKYEEVEDMPDKLTNLPDTVYTF